MLDLPSKNLFTRQYLLLIFFCILMPFSFSQDESNFKNDYSYLLKNNTLIQVKDNVRSRLVDYSKWGRDPKHKNIISYIRNKKITDLSKNEKLAFWINAYNLLTIDLIIRTGEKQSIKNQGSLFKNVWKKHTWRIDKNLFTLHKIEHEILRKYGDPRIHFAINCASLSCPDLHNEAFIAEKINIQLDNVTYDFLKNDTKGLRLKDGNYFYSKIFKWFSSDFGGRKNVRRFIGNYLPEVKINNFSGYIEYNWNLNSIAN